jgi:hypothetical protein
LSRGSAESSFHVCAPIFVRGAAAAAIGLGRLLRPTMNAAHRFLAEQRVRRPQSAEQQVRLAVDDGRRRMEAYAFSFSPSASPQPSRPSSAFSPVEMYARAVTTPVGDDVLPLRRPTSAAPHFQPPSLRSRPSPSAYLSDGRPKRRPSSAHAVVSTGMLQSSASSPSCRGSRPATPGARPPTSPQLVRTWSGGWRPGGAPSESPSAATAVASAPAAHKRRAEREWVTSGGIYWAQKEAALKAAAEAEAAERAVHPRRMSPAHRQAHTAERARTHAVWHGHGVWHNHSTWTAGVAPHRDSWVFVRQREHSRVDGRRLGPCA